MNPTEWTATESATLEPFPRADKALDAVRFRCVPTADFASTQRYWFEVDAGPDPIAPELLLDVDPEDVAHRAGIPVGDLRLVIAIRDRAVARWEAIKAWPLAEVPREPFRIPDLDPRRFALGRRMEFVVLVTPATELPPEAGRAHSVAHVVASRSFEVGVERDGTRFNVAVQDPDWFIERWMAKDTVWAVDWQNKDVDLPPIECLTVVINRDFEDALQAALDGPAATAVGTQIAIEVFVEVALMALTLASEFSDDPGSLIGTVNRNLGIRSDTMFEDWKARLQDESERAALLSIVRGRMQSSLGLGRRLS